ncbi:MAG: thioredoxin domain-containing protein [Clostridia bacterium]|nr:thioredoxin domain-containing protein [Clostridia bacterium]
MRVSSFPAESPFSPVSVQSFSSQQKPLSFLPFCADAFAQARMRHIPVFLLIGDDIPTDSSLTLHLMERTVPIRLRPGERPDVELLCQRAGELTSGEGALPLCALMTADALPFLAAPLPPVGFPADPSRLYVWLSQADRRYTQNLNACHTQALQVVRSFRAEAASRPYSPRDAAHDLSRALAAIEDKRSGGFGGIKAPLVCALRFAQRAAERGDKAMHSALSRALDAMLSSALYDPLDGGFFSATLTEDWHVFVPQKPLGINAMLAPILLSSGYRSEAIRVLNLLIDAFALSGGGLSPTLQAPRETYCFTAEQACAALGSENGLRACRLLSLLRQQVQPDPDVIPSRFSPIIKKTARVIDGEPAARYPRLPASLLPEDSAFLRRAMPVLLRARAARTPQHPLPYVVTEHCALAASTLAVCGKRLGEPRCIQAAQRAVSFLSSHQHAIGIPQALPASITPAAILHTQATCGASAALALAQLSLGQIDGMEEYAHSGLRLLGAALHAFVREDGLVMHTPRDSAAFFPRVPAVYDGELPSPAALLVHGLRIADTLRPQAHYDEAMDTIWRAAAPAAKAQPIACAALIDAMTANA